MAEDITTALSRFRFLFVISRNSSFTYKGRAVDVKQIGRELGVQYVLEGSVRKSGPRMRVTGQLIDASTDTHLWADNFDGAHEDIFDLQDKLTASVVGALIPSMRHAEIERAKHRPTESLDAHMTHMRGVASLYLWTKAGVDEALRLAYEAIKLDPDYSMAYGLAAACYVARKSTGWTADPAREMAEVEALTKRGAEVGRDDAWALGSCGFATASILGDLDTAVHLMDRALALNANLALIWAESAYLRAWRGEPDLALVHVARAKRLSPVDPHMFTMEGAAAMAHFIAGRYEEAFASAETALRQNPFFSPGTRLAVASAALLGRMEDARKYFARLQMLDPQLRISNLGRTRSFCTGRMIMPGWRKDCAGPACRSDGGRLDSPTSSVRRSRCRHPHGAIPAGRAVFPAVAFPASKRRRRAGADHLARLGADAAKSMRTAAFEIIGIAGIEDAALVVDGHLEPAGDHDAAFLALVNQRHPAGVAAGFVSLLENLQRAAEQIVADLAIGDRLLADLGQFVGSIEGLARPLWLDGEEFGQSHRNAVEDALERADRRIHLVGFDQRDRRIGHAGALRQRALR